MCKKKLKLKKDNINTKFSTKEAISADHILVIPTDNHFQDPENAKIAYSAEAMKNKKEFKASNFTEFYCEGNPECDACNLEETVKIMEAQSDCYNYMLDEECPECSIVDCADESEN